MKGLDLKHLQKLDLLQFLNRAIEHAVKDKQLKQAPKYITTSKTGNNLLSSSSNQVYNAAK